jgi:hypothetical protein
MQDLRKRYRAIGEAYNKLFKAPPPTAVVKSEIPTTTMEIKEPDSKENQIFEMNCNLPVEQADGAFHQTLLV